MLYSWQCELNTFNAPFKCCHAKGKLEERRGLNGWHDEEFNKATHLSSHLHLCKGPVIAADVEQADGLWQQPTKDKKLVVNTRNTRVATTVQINHNAASIIQLVTERQRCAITPLRALLSLHRKLQNANDRSPRQ